MAVEKALWFNDAHCAVALTLDDLSYAYVDTLERGVCPLTDWGYGCRRPDSVFRYFENQFLARYPEVKCTIFTPFGAHSAALADGGHPRHAGDIYESPEFGELLRHIVAGGHEIAYHGHHHGHCNPTLNPSTWVEEHREHAPDDYRRLLATDIERIQRELGIVVRGGRFPAYRYDAAAEAAVTSGPFKWWSFDYTPLTCQYGYRQGVFALPTNVPGNLLSAWNGSLRGLIRHARAGRALDQLVRSRALLTVAEHVGASRPDGQRQRPNILDDIDALSRLFARLRGTDAWHATCSEIAHYRESYDSTELRWQTGDVFEVVYAGTWGQPLLSLVADQRYLVNTVTGKVHGGLYKTRRWVFNRVVAATYRLAATVDDRASVVPRECPTDAALRGGDEMDQS